ncbi:uncharacterized protein [Narcine bancroftii]|uniref:uncharacterized protein n=1 Tax=Narcine bancroftii TaxID=1343680 RepID=UPI0038317BBD
MDMEVSFLVDTGARFSTLTGTEFQDKTSSSSVQLIGFSGTPENLPFSTPLVTSVAGQTFTHQYILSARCPTNLLGRDLLVKCGASILCGPSGIEITFPNGYSMNCSVTTLHSSSQMLLAAAGGSVSEGQWADIYWGLLETEDPQKVGLLKLYNQWKPWIQTLHPYTPPSDPPHMTLFYDRDGDEMYQHAFYEEVEGRQWEINSDYIVIGKEGVAAAVALTSEQLEWYEMAGEAIPHVTLAIGTTHQAKDLGPMCRNLKSLRDWSDTQIPTVQFSSSGQAYRILSPTHDQVLLEHRQIERFHGREKMDHPDSAPMLDSLPENLWSVGPADVGFCQQVDPITFELSDCTPIWQMQYYIIQNQRQLKRCFRFWVCQVIVGSLSHRMVS